MSICSSCNSGFSGGQLIVPCVCCNNLFHGTIECTGVTASEQKVFTLKTKQPLLVFRCKTCADSGGKNSPFAQALSELRDATSELASSNTKISALHDDLVNMQKEIIGVKSEVEKVKSDVEEVKSDIINIKERIQPLPSESDFVEVLDAVRKMPGVDEIDREIQERIRRSCNLFLYNVAEPSIGNADVRDVVVDLFKNINNLDVGKITARRIPSKTSGISPILVGFSSREEVLRVIGAKKRLPSYVKLSVDRTRHQRETFKSVLDAVKEHNHSNPTNKLVVKYKNGIPTAVPDYSTQRSGADRNNPMQRSKNN